MEKRFWIRCHYITFICLLLFTTHAFAQNSSLNQSNVKKIAQGIYMIHGMGGCMITAVDGPDGVLVIDTGTKPGKLDSVIATISKHPVKYILNTNFHFDHVGDNKLLCDKGATIIAHENTRDVLAAGWESPDFPGFKVQPEIDKYLPKICFKDTLNQYFNNNTIQAIHYPLAHSSGDAIYWFRNQNIIHIGDLFVLYGFPYIDSYHGGTFTGFIKAVDDILKLCDDKTILIPGHGIPGHEDISNRQGLMEYRDMLVESKVIIAKLIDERKSLDEIITLDPISKLLKGPTQGYKKLFITVVYNELTKK